MLRYYQSRPQHAYKWNFHDPFQSNGIAWRDEEFVPQNSKKVLDGIQTKKQ